MRIRRGLLFWGLFLIPLGGIPLLARAGTIDAARFADACARRSVGPGRRLRLDGSVGH